MEEKILEELQKLYDNSRIGALVQEICEYFATKDNYEDGSYEDEIEPPEITEAVYTLFCLQAREQILDELTLVSKKFPALYERVRDFHQLLLVNMDCKSLEESSAKAILQYSVSGRSSGTDVSSQIDVSSQEMADAGESISAADTARILDQVELCVRTTDSLSEALDKFYRYLHS